MDSRIYNIENFDYLYPDRYIYINSQDGTGVFGIDGVKINNNLNFNWNYTLTPPTGYSQVLSLDNINIDGTINHIYNELGIGNNKILIYQSPNTYYTLTIPIGTYTANDLETIINDQLTLLTLPITLKFNENTKKVEFTNTGAEYQIITTPIEQNLSFYNELMISPLGLTRLNNFIITTNGFGLSVSYSPRCVDLRRTRNIRIIINYNTNSHDTFSGVSSSNICTEVPIPYFWNILPISYNLNSEFQFTPKIQVPGGSINNITFQVLSDTNSFLNLNGGGYRFQLVFRIYPEIELPLRDGETLAEWEKNRTKEKEDKRILLNAKLKKLKMKSIMKRNIKLK